VDQRALKMDSFERRSYELMLLERVTSTKPVTKTAYVIENNWLNHWIKFRNSGVNPPGIID